MPAQKPRDERTGGVGGIGRRLDRLEAGAGRPCGECGHAPGRFVEYDAVWIDAPDDGSVEDGGPGVLPGVRPAARLRGDLGRRRGEGR